MSVRPSSNGKPTIVLVHGAFAESSSWNGVVGPLLDDGFAVLAVANPLRGVRRDSQYLAGVLAGLDGDVVLVGHSYGGMLISNAATGNDRVRALVFVCAFAPEAGESAASLAGRYEGGTLGETLAAFDLPDGGGRDLYIRQDRYGTEDRNIPVAAHRFMAERAGSRRTVELDGGSHAVAVPRAVAVVELIREAAAAVPQD